MALDMIHRYQRDAKRKTNRLCVCDADEQRTDETGALRHGDRRDIGPCTAGFFQRQAHHGHDGLQMFARGQFGDDAAVAGMRGKLRGDNGAQNPLAIGVFHHGSRRFVAR